MPIPDQIKPIRERLRAHNQEHLLRFFDELPSARRDHLLGQIAELDLDQLDELIERYVREKPQFALPDDLEPAPYYAHDPESPAGRGRYDAAKYHEAGEALIRAGKIAAFTVAGGQGTRLGWNGPKGTFPATPVTGKPLFHVFAEQILANEKKYGVTVPWYIMTSPSNDAATRAFFADNNNFGLNRRNIFMFPQGVMPSCDPTSGRLLLAEKDTLAVSPDGHGGALRALARSRAVEDMIARGIEHISYFQVDNPLVKLIDPLFIGLHAQAPDSSAEMSSKMVPKVNWQERVGVFCRSRSKMMVVEYSDLPDDLARETNDDGSLRFLGGSIAIHLIGVKFVERLTEGGTFALPWHRAEKKTLCIDLETGERIEPLSIKLEAFVFDAIPLAESSIVYETSRVEEFAPIKNAEGIDSPATSRRIQSDRNANWLQMHGVVVPRDRDGHADALIEIGPLTALAPEDLAGKYLPPEIEPGVEIVF